MDSTTAIIPFRKGSKGIVDKNMLRLFDLPLWRHTMMTALHGGIDRVILATDYHPDALGEIPEGVEVWNRQGMINAQDDASTDMVLRDWLEEAAHVTGAVMLMQATNQFTTSDDVTRALRIYNEDPCGILISAVRCGHIIWRKDGAWKSTPLVRRQAMPEQWIENGAFHIFQSNQVRRYGTRYAGKIRFYEMCAESIHDIDSSNDWAIVRALMGVED